MKEEELIRQFISFVVVAAKLVLQVQDAFFSERINKKLVGTINTFVDFLILKRGTIQTEQYVAQYMSSRKDFLQILNDFNELLGEIEHIKIVSHTPLLITKRSLLALELKFLLASKKIHIKEQKQEVRHEQVRKPDSSVRVSRKKSSHRLNINQESIIDFIRVYKDVRTKDIIDNFSEMSERTVKRNLKELVHHGLIQKRLEDRSVFYSTISLS